jgi:hypothetical protein
MSQRPSEQDPPLPSFPPLQNTTVIIRDTNFTSNTGTGVSNTGTGGGAFVRSENPGAYIDMLRNQFTENRNGLVRSFWA